MHDRRPAAVHASAMLAATGSPPPTTYTHDDDTLSFQSTPVKRGPRSHRRPPANYAKGGWLFTSQCRL